MIRYGAKSFPYGGWWAIPRLPETAGCSSAIRRILNSQRLKEFIWRSRAECWPPRQRLGVEKRRLLFRNPEPIPNGGRKQLDQARVMEGAQLPPRLRARFLRGMIHAGIQEFSGGRGWRDR
jgi:hypothetical protein